MCKVPPDLFHSKSWHGLCRCTCVKNRMHVYSQGDSIFNDQDRTLWGTGENGKPSYLGSWLKFRPDCVWLKEKRPTVGWQLLGKMSCFATQNGQFSMSGSHHCQMVMVVRFAGNLSSNARDCLDRENKQPSLCAVLWTAVGGNDTASSWCYLPWVQRRTHVPITAHKALVRLTPPLKAWTETKVNGSTLFTLPWLVAAAMLCQQDTCIYTRFSLPDLWKH